MAYIVRPSFSKIKINHHKKLYVCLFPDPLASIDQLRILTDSNIAFQDLTFSQSLLIPSSSYIPKSTKS